MQHAGIKACHWCHHPFPKILGRGSGNCTAVNNRRGLPPEHHWRDDPAYGEDRVKDAFNRPARLRTHEETVSTGLYLKDATGTEFTEVKRATGVCGASVLAYIALFDIILDVMIDWMHTIARIFAGSLVPATKGLGQPQVINSNV